MRMDIFERLNEEQKVNAMEQFVRIYGVDEFLNDCEMTEAGKILEGFECGIDENGNLYPPGDAWTLEELADEIVMGYADVAKSYHVDIPQRRKAFNNAMDSAMVEYSQIPHAQLTRMKDLSWWCEHNGIYFMDYDGGMVFFVK